MAMVVMVVAVSLAVHATFSHANYSHHSEGGIFILFRLLSIFSLMLCLLLFNLITRVASLLVRKKWMAKVTCNFSVQLPVAHYVSGYSLATWLNWTWPMSSCLCFCVPCCKWIINSFFSFLLSQLQTLIDTCTQPHPVSIKRTHLRSVTFTHIYPLFPCPYDGKFVSLFPLLLFILSCLLLLLLSSSVSLSTSLYSVRRAFAVAVRRVKVEFGFSCDPLLPADLRLPPSSIHPSVLM